MGSYRDDGDKEYRFFDAKQDVSSDSDLALGCSDSDESLSESEKSDSGRFQYDFWLRSPSTVKERRAQFLKSLGGRLDCLPKDDREDNYFRSEISRVMENSGAVLRNSIVEDQFSSVRSSLSGLSTDSFQPVQEMVSGTNGVFRSCILDGARECEASGQVEGGDLCKLAVESDRVKHFQTGEDLSCMHLSPRGLIQKEDEAYSNSEKKVERRMRSFWFRRVNSISCVTGKNGRVVNAGNSGSNRARGIRMRRVKVKHKRKLLKELSALFEGQDIMAHDGAILTMKFSFDGQYLASGGEDKTLRVWKVVENERANEIDITTIDPSCVYFAVNHHSQLVPVAADKERITWLKSLKRAADSACVILPQKIFRILEEPLHVFKGHKAEILDLSWSKNNLLLSSSVDKTVCLWQVGCDQCLKIFPHSNYVTSIQFNPMNDDYFISGSLDGKVRVWEISGSRVVDWADFRDIVTAVCYRPDGLGGIIGFMTGTCRFFSLEDKQLQLEAEICLTSKKKSPCKRITGFQFFPKDSSKVMVSSADSHLRIISGINVVNNFKVPRSAGNPVYASFTSDGNHIISASQDSNVYMWNYFSMDDSSICQQKPLRSYECFPGHASIAVPWFGLNVGNSYDEQKPRLLDKTPPIDMLHSSYHSLSMGQRSYIESIPRGSATWPEEKLPPSSSPKFASSIHKSKHRFLNTSFQSSFSSSAWCLVIVTAGWDGRIRSFLNYGLPMPR